MNYLMHHFSPGDILYAEDLNEMDEQIFANAQAIELSTSVCYTAQELSDDQKQQACKNIGTLSRREIESLLNGDSIPREAITYETATGGYWCSDGSWVSGGSFTAMRTNLIPLMRGDRFAYSGYSEYSIPSVVWFDADENALSHEQWTNPQGGIIVYKAPDNASYARFYSFSYSSNIKLEVHYLPTGKKREIIIESKQGGFWNWLGEWGANINFNGSRTNPILVLPGDTFYYTGADISNIYGTIFYGSDGAIVQRIMHSGDGTIGSYTVTPPEDSVLVRFFSGYSLGVSYQNDDLEESGSVNLSPVKQMNCLWGKKYVACGDSFTNSNFGNYVDANGNSGADSDAYDPTTNTFKTYPWWIAQRNQMVLVNEAQSGSTMHNNGADNAFSVSRYTRIPKDADYITLSFGLNESSAPIGTLSDTTNETVMGAWNLTLEYLITNIPYAKIGIIIPDAWCSAAMRDALIQIAEYWGIPYLDLCGDTKVPLLIGGKRGKTVSSRAISLRNAAFQISAEDLHPNLKAHEYRSTIIEHFLRSL